MNSCITSLVFVNKLSPTTIKSPSLKLGFLNFPLWFLVKDIFLLSIVPSELNLINVTGPLRVFAPPAISIASERTLALDTFLGPGSLQ